MNTPESCYCGLWRTAPDTLQAQGIPQGYCGRCSLCGAPGHTRAHPSEPITDAWCDACYARLAASRGAPLAWAVPAFILLVAIAVTGVALWRLWT